MDGDRDIIHVDMDAFFASVEQRDDPALRGKPVLVGGDGRRGVVAAASYEARVFGCRSAQPMGVARRMCPHAVIVPPRGRAYHEASKRVFQILGEFTPCVEPLSIDEAFLDVTGSRRLHGPPIRIGEAIKRRVRETLDLTASVGIAPNKFLAKLASDMDKPDGLTVIDEHWIEHELPLVPIERMWGVGPATAAALAELGVRTFGDLQRCRETDLEPRVGSIAARLHALAHGRDFRPVETSRSARSISHEQTFGTDAADPDVVRGVLLQQTEDVGRRVRAAGVHAGRVTVKIRFGDFQTVTRSHTLDEPTDCTDALWSAALELFDRWAESYRPVRLIGMAAGQLGDAGAQLDLFEQDERERQRRIDRTADEITAKFGRGAIGRGGGGGRR